jgi:hypothetical protein
VRLGARCRGQGLRLARLSLPADDNLLLKSVQFNGSAVSDFWTEAQGVRPGAQWLYIPVFKQYSDLSDGYPIDVVITVRGTVPELCPANDFLHSGVACEFVFHGKDDMSQCCPHGATRRAGPYDDCCVDDIEKSPYRVQYLASDIKANTTTYEFQVCGQ